MSNPGNNHKWGEGVPMPFNQLARLGVDIQSHPAVPQGVIFLMPERQPHEQFEDYAARCAVIRDIE